MLCYTSEKTPLLFKALMLYPITLLINHSIHMRSLLHNTSQSRIKKLVMLHPLIIPTAHQGYRWEENVYPEIEW